MRRLLVILMALLLGLTWAQTIRIGAVASATGSAAALGEPEANTFRMLQDQLNAAGGIAGMPVEIIFYDDATDNQQAVTNVRRLIEEDEVHAVICCTITANSLAIIDAVQGAEVPNISMAASASIIEPVVERAWVFKTPQTDRLMIGGIIEDMQALGLGSLAFLGLDDAYGEGGLTELQRRLDGTDIELTTVERYGRTDTNVTAQVLRAVSGNPEAVLVWGVVADTELVVRSLRERGYQGQIYVSHGVGNPTFLQQVGEAGEGVRLPIGPLLVVDDLEDDNPIKAVDLAYQADYEAVYGEGTASTFGGHAWDAVQGLKLAIEQAAADGTDFSDVAASRQAIREALETMPAFTGVGGVFDWTAEDHLGLDERALVIAVIEGGAWRLAEAE